MAMDDEAARKARSEKLRTQIDRLKKKDGSDTSTSVPEKPDCDSSGGKSPREFIHERMRELDEEDSEQ